MSHAHSRQSRLEYGTFKIASHARLSPQDGGGPTAAVVDVIPRSREVGQSWLTSNFTTLRALAPAAAILLRRRPRLLLVNGPGTCIPVCGAAFVFRRASMQGCNMWSWPCLCVLDLQQHLGRRRSLQVRLQLLWGDLPPSGHVRFILRSMRLTLAGAGRYRRDLVSSYAWHGLLCARCPRYVLAHTPQQMAGSQQILQIES